MIFYQVVGIFDTREIHRGFFETEGAAIEQAKLLSHHPIRPDHVIVYKCQIQSNSRSTRNEIGWLSVEI